jgi:hypothetical protein
MATPRDIAKVFYKLSWLEGNTEVLQQLLNVMADDYKGLSKDVEADEEAIVKWKEISTKCRDLARLLEA